MYFIDVQTIGEYAGWLVFAYGAGFSSGLLFLAFKKVVSIF